MSDILLIQPPVRDFYLTEKRTVPYGLACIAAVLIKEGFDVELFDGLATAKSRTSQWPAEMDYLKPYYGRSDNTPFGLFHSYRHYGYSFQHIGKVARDSGAFLVGISSLFTAYSDEAVQAARVVKKSHPGCKIVLGGHHPTSLPESALACEAVDYILRGEGEVAMPLLVKAVARGLPVEGIPGIGYRKKTGGFVIKEPAVMKNLDRYPPPAHHLIKSTFYRRKNRRSLVVVASRGCPMKCSYCALGASSAIKYRRRSVESVVEEIESAVLNDDVGLIDFEDENLSLDKKWFLNLLDRIFHRFGNLKLELRAMNGLYPPSLDEDIIAAMKKAGFSALNLSLCTTDKEQLRRFCRPDITRYFKTALLLAKEYGLEAVGYIIAGAPGQSPEVSVDDLLFLAGQRVLAGLSVYYPAPGSRDFEQCRKMELLPRDFALMRSSAIPISHRTSRKDAVTLLRLARILNFMKSLKDQGKDIPGPEPYTEEGALPMESRMETGIQLLKWFLNDGKIRGITKNGELYEHFISEWLTRKFIFELDTHQLKGCMT